ncbi:putative sulfate exporter family transporter [Dyadobacter sp. LHD-138]|uniref:YeiH family protein n=1 Tax=Dyadobacter sp. LHD-138 TaxID=3071413 RepID=UPI0027E20A35|nr:putative sulfate exporter family transporter [Dyadobacter sp. LHD-138]MDQ6477583.1 putative sulfate exporter family transporter [Dyadobacter sp. LHD-138]
MESIHRPLSLTYRHIAFGLLFLICLLPFADAPIALLLGFIATQVLGHPFAQQNHKIAPWLLKTSVVGLGFGMNLSRAMEAGKEGFVFTMASIVITLLGGLWLGKRLGVEMKSSFLITSGTAICGGSAIAALSPLVKANEKQISTALGVVFVLNSLALFVFPILGNFLQMTQHEFGIWSAIAIHDTSSVVGAAAKYGNEALQTATTVKLERALWIIPLSLITMFLNRNGAKIQFPYFIGLFIIAMITSSYFTDYQFIYSNIIFESKKILLLTMFLIGAGLNIDSIKSAGIKPFVQGISLWFFISGISLLAIVALR